MFNSKKNNEDKVNYEVTVLGARQTKNDAIVMVDLDVNARETGISGNFVGRIQGAKGTFDLQFLTWDFS